MGWIFTVLEKCPFHPYFSVIFLNIYEIKMWLRITTKFLCSIPKFYFSVTVSTTNRRLCCDTPVDARQPDWLWGHPSCRSGIWTEGSTTCCAHQRADEGGTTQPCLVSRTGRPDISLGSMGGLKHYLYYYKEMFIKCVVGQQHSMKLYNSDGIEKISFLLLNWNWVIVNHYLSRQQEHLPQGLVFWWVVVRLSMLSIGMVTLTGEQGTAVLVLVVEEGVAKETVCQDLSLKCK